MIKWLNVPNDTKRRAYTQIAENTGVSAFVAEKDWWVVQTLAALFESSIKDHLVFKGGTSLSKAWKLIERFSEDVDLAVGREFFDFKGELSTTQGKKLRKVAGQYIDNTLFQELEKLFKENGFIESGIKLQLEEGADSDRDRVIYVYYPNVIEGPGYMEPRVKIEIGCRSLMEPFTVQTFSSLMDEQYADREFAQAPISIPTVNPERTFLEKVFLLHEEFQRPLEKRRIERLSRHLYDIVKLARAGSMGKALENSELYKTIVVHRQKFNHISGVDYNLHVPQSIQPIPPSIVTAAWKADYNTMIEQMIYEQNPPSFDEILRELLGITKTINSLPWQIDFNFPPPIQK